ncbi:hypothetical protein GQ55_8G203700 [Panicum hallii var. hallii]|uniref:Knottin scorpion toxin-like domain-containing protein n=1 Tax=Panicum hallii var. hallii TaxID=1504633 RepID=A0A2T7CPF4_9POAL|nr:hypothetical protein GQ55_8G203700 [Panicum hallii var. hallii]
MSFSKNTVVACFTLALLNASSYGGEFAGEHRAPVYPKPPCIDWFWTMTTCKSDTTCLTLCVEKKLPYIGGICAMGSCYCAMRCSIAPAPDGAARPGPALA